MGINCTFPVKLSSPHLDPLILSCIICTRDAATQVFIASKILCFRQVSCTEWARVTLVVYFFTGGVIPEY